MEEEFHFSLFISVFVYVFFFLVVAFITKKEKNMLSVSSIYLLQAEGSSAESIAALARVDTVKQRMEAAYETLQVETVR